uniref:Ig-like domain-containing protein n=1 Tax=Anabas testudineus TaxID=64144 RepID=A0A3Q1JWD8_ANATE
FISVLEKSLVVQPGQSLAITCQVSGDSRSTYAIGWIRQREGKALDWILIIWADDKLAHNNSTKNKFSCSRDTSTGAVTLTGQNLQPEDTAVYYCAHLHKYPHTLYRCLLRSTSAFCVSSKTEQRSVCVTDGVTWPACFVSDPVESVPVLSWCIFDHSFVCSFVFTMLLSELEHSILDFLEISGTSRARIA